MAFSEDYRLVVVWGFFCLFCFPQTSLFCMMFSVLSFLMKRLNLIKVLRLCQVYQRSDAVFLVYSVRCLIIAIFLITNDHFDHFVKVETAGLHCCKAPLYLF